MYYIVTFDDNNFMKQSKKGKTQISRKKNGFLVFFEKGGLECIVKFFKILINIYDMLPYYP